MNPRRITIVLPPALAALLLGGCVAIPAGPYRSFDTTKFTIANTNKFMLLDRGAPSSVTCTGLQERVLPDGRLEVVANVKNNEPRRVQVQVDCVFKNDEGAATGDATPFQTVILPEFATQAVQFTSGNPEARRYTIRVRQVR